MQPKGYVAFWDAVAPYGFSMQERDHCDGLIAGGTVDAALVLDGLKFMAMIELRRSLNLKHRIHEPVTAQYLRSTH